MYEMMWLIIEERNIENRRRGRSDSRNTQCSQRQVPLVGRKQASEANVRCLLPSITLTYYLQNRTFMTHCKRKIFILSLNKVVYLPLDYSKYSRIVGVSYYY